jgi:putative transposase
MTLREQQLTRKIRKSLVMDLPKEERENAIEQIKSLHEKKPLLLTCKLKIHPIEEQQEVLWVLAENCRLVYYFALKERKEWWERNKNIPKKNRDKNDKKPTYRRQSKQLPLLKQQYPRYKQNYSKTLQGTLKRLDGDCNSFYALRNNGDKKANMPRYPGKKYFTTIIYNQSGFKIKGNSITFSHYYPTRETKEVDLKFNLHEKFDFTAKKVRQVNIFQDHKTKEFYISLTYEESTPEYYDNGIYLAIDQGVINIVAATNSQGKSYTIKNKRVDRYWQPKIEEVQTKRDYCKKGSNRWYWYNSKLWKMIRKQANQQKDNQHKNSKKVVENTKANTIIIGALNVKEMSKSKNGDKKNDKSRHRTMQSTGAIGRFAGFLTYKAERVGKRVIRITERDTTKTCCYCMKKENRQLSERTISCECGLVIDRDINSSSDLMQRFLILRALSQERLVVRQRLLNDLRVFREKFFATHSQSLNESSFSNAEVVRTRKQSSYTKSLKRII